MKKKIFVLMGLMAALAFVLAKGCGGGGGGGQETNCTDGVDNDSDNYTDCADSDCAHNPACTSGNEICNNGQDDDGDGFADCSDADCANDPSCTGNNETNCGDGIDNDGDGYTDCADVADCAQNQACQNTEAGHCNDQIDNDNDSFTDCADADCLNDPVCSGNTEVGHCNDGIDNDNDGFMDCQDHADCDNDPACSGGGDLSCQALLWCLYCCPDQTCGDACVAASTTDGESQANAFFTCRDNNCSTQCNGSDPAACETCIDTNCSSQWDACDWGPAGATGCMTLVQCLNACTTPAPTSGSGTATTCPTHGYITCRQTCYDAVDQQGSDLLDALLDCLETACYDTCFCPTCDPNSTACNTCWTDAQGSGGACYNQLQTCGSDG